MLSFLQFTKWRWSKIPFIPYSTLIINNESTVGYEVSECKSKEYTKLRMVYEGTGALLTRSVLNASNVEIEKRDYIGNFEYVNTVLESVMLSEGRYHASANRWEYHFKDHLGNTRLVYTDINNNGRIDVGSGEILEEIHYYPFGMQFGGHYWKQSGYDYRYKFNDIERVKSLDLDIDFAYYRSMDATTGRW